MLFFARMPMAWFRVRTRRQLEKTDADTRRATDIAERLP
jgi:hypothetical protein